MDKEVFKRLNSLIEELTSKNEELEYINSALERDVVDLEDKISELKEELNEELEMEEVIKFLDKYIVESIYTDSLVCIWDYSYRKVWIKVF